MIKYALLKIILCASVLVGSSQQSTTDIKIEYLKKLPGEFSDEGEFYTYDSVSLKKEKYLLATDYKNGIIRINGKDIRLKLISTKELSFKKSIEVFSGEGYIIKIKTSINGRVDYTYTSRGTMEISKGGLIKIIKVQCIGGD